MPRGIGMPPRRLFDLPIGSHQGFLTHALSLQAGIFLG